MAKVGIYSGSFNPVHFGHVGLAKWVIENTDLDELWLLVSPNNPLKDAKILAPEQERLEGVREAIKDIPGLVASDFEFHLPRPSYTANTLRELQKAYPQHEFTLIIGEDNIAIFNRWREYEFILENFRIFVYPRRGSLSGEAGQGTPFPYWRASFRHLIIRHSCRPRTSVTRSPSASAAACNAAQSLS